MKKYITSAVLALACAEFATFAVLLINNAAQIDAELFALYGSEFTPTSTAGPHFFAVMSAVFFVSAFVSAIKVKSNPNNRG